jgi:2-phospho-L-lactate guanylyltransferase
MNLAIVVPVRSFARAKQRLSPLLSEDERSRLARTMAEDVFTVVSRLQSYGRFVISEDAEVLELARKHGLTVIGDQIRGGQSAAVMQGFEVAWEAGYASALTVPGDIPGLTSSELEDLATYRPEVEVLLSPDRQEIGTNGLRLVPPDAIALHFGEDSLSLHREESIRRGRSFVLRRHAGIACDLDRPDDLAAFLRLARPCRSLELLKAMRIDERLSVLESRRSNG